MEQSLYELPEGWRWEKLFGVCSFLNGYAFKSKDYTDEGHFLIRIGNVQDGYIILDNPKYTAIPVGQDRFSLNIGDLLMSLTGNVGRVGFVAREHLPAALNQRVAKIDVDDARVLLKKFLYSFFRSPLFLEEVVKHAHGAAQKNVSTKDVANIKIPLPPLNEQKRIVAKLDALFTRIDAAITHLQETLKLAKALFASETNALLEKLAEEFGVVSLASVVKINSGIALPKIFKDWNSSGTIPFYKVAQMNNDARIMKDAEITFDADVAVENRIKIFPKGSVLIPKRGGAILTDKKRLLVEDASYDSNVMGLKADEKTVSDQFLYRFMLSIHLGDYIDTAVIPQINNKHIERMEIPPAPLERQKQVITHLDALAEHTRTLEAETQERLDQLATLKSSLLDAAFRGQL